MTEVPRMGMSAVAEWAAWRDPVGASVAQTACDGSDVIYIPTDNTAAKNTEAIANVVLPAKVPVAAMAS